MLKIIDNPTLIDENQSGVAWEITNFQLEFMEKICFISSMLFQNFLFVMVRNLAQSICILSLTEIFCFYLHNTTPKYTHIFCLKEIDSVQFIYLHWSVVRKMANWMLKTSEQKTGYFYATPEWIQDLNCETVRAYIR